MIILLFLLFPSFLFRSIVFYSKRLLLFDPLFNSFFLSLFLEMYYIWKKIYPYVEFNWYIEFYEEVDKTCGKNVWNIGILFVASFLFLVEIQVTETDTKSKSVCAKYPTLDLITGRVDFYIIKTYKEWSEIVNKITRLSKHLNKRCLSSLFDFWPNLLCASPPTCSLYNSNSFVRELCDELFHEFRAINKRWGGGKKKKKRTDRKFTGT